MLYIKYLSVIDKYVHNRAVIYTLSKKKKVRVKLLKALNSLYIISNIIIACYIKYKYFYRNLMKGIYEEKIRYSSDKPK